MSKELENENKDIIFVSGYEYTRVRDRFRDVLKPSKEDNAKPSEALECLIGLEKEIIQRDGRITDFLKIKFNTIKQALLKAQENEKEYNDYGSARERWKIICQMIKRMFGFDIEEKWSDDDKVITQTLSKAQEQEKVLEILKSKLEFVFFGRTKEVKIEQDDDSDKYVYLMNGFDDTKLPQEEFDLLNRYLG